MSDLHPAISLADYIKNINVASSLWLKESTLFPQFEGWQDGYGVFTYSVKEKDNVIEYIKNQLRLQDYDNHRRIYRNWHYRKDFILLKFLPNLPAV